MNFQRKFCGPMCESEAREVLEMAAQEIKAGKHVDRESVDDFYRLVLGVILEFRDEADMIYRDPLATVYFSGARVHGWTTARSELHRAACPILQRNHIVYRNGKRDKDW
jgi:hypothetical protein